MTHAKLRRMHTELRTQDLHSSGMLHRTDRQLGTDVSGQLIGPIFNGQAVHSSWTA